ncbi:zinc finger protein JAGGED-like isoform X2 [Juglans regia]|uniref:Zinc finger protein JAGGED-like isoform X2 n=1 Tax=Juglans regia TaxID=51240 RepID=A0A2I4HPD6_JUGRE|nr:zinc finger protein JAGGED-like isoform X2 [Juglans regia]
MRPDEGNPLDLNNLPDDFRDHGKQVFEADISSSGYRKKKSGGKDGKDDCGKVYECRFCSLKFCKSQALGGHMNRHRQERETETLNRARQLVFSTDNLVSQTPSHLGQSYQEAIIQQQGPPLMEIQHYHSDIQDSSLDLPPPSYLRRRLSHHNHIYTLLLRVQCPFRHPIILNNNIR